MIAEKGIPDRLPLNTKELKKPIRQLYSIIKLEIKLWISSSSRISQNRKVYKEYT